MLLHRGIQVIQAELAVAALFLVGVAILLQGGCTATVPSRRLPSSRVTSTRV
jgi:hypothetical protein